MALRLVVIYDVYTTVGICEGCHALVLSEESVFIRYCVLSTDAILAQVLFHYRWQARMGHAAHKDLMGWEVLKYHDLLVGDQGKLLGALPGLPF